MKYDDFSLPQNWNQIAKAYSENLKHKGFVFVRLDDNHNKLTNLVKDCCNLLAKAKTIYNQFAKKQSFSKNSHISQLATLTQTFLTQMLQLYPDIKHQQTRTNPQNFHNLPSIVALEAKIIKNILLILQQEDQPEKQAVINANLLSRLDFLEQLK